ncbi:N-acetylmuramoyl-L-alanine amidase family protein [Virgibacillus doumboii]|uniref:N-acetylmuramoyl-L-alanine amidase family protein n=1 Tax=Virgibacillus doumboii TaxID=2697503 RepID=UPI0013E0DEE0|nr:N-acetylmuramoyl-L-alanine amidase [Virgibacillus doumboii]
MTLKLYLDPGHGGNDPGAVGNGLQEKDVVLDMSLQIRDYLLEHYEGIEVRMSRTDDTFLSLQERTDVANAWGADILLSVHVNAGGGTGFESYVYPGVGAETKELQDKIHNELMNDTYADFRDRGQKTANFHMLRESAMPAVLTENLFIDTRKDADFLKQEKQKRDSAINHAHGIAKYASLNRIEKSNPKPNSGPEGYVGKRVESKVNNLRFYNKPTWSDDGLVNTIDKGWGFPEIVDKVKVGSGHQYKVKNSNGDVYYITAAEKFVRVE